jgi:ribosomal protein S18 acetylase RimI-like enzyme
MFVRDALPDELGEVGELRVRAYTAQDLLAVAPRYAATLRTLGGDGGADVLVAVEDGRLLGTVLVQPWGPASEIATGADESELRALAVDPQSQGRGVGRALLHAAMDRTRTHGADHLVLCTQPAMAAAQRLYRAEGFARLPERDWSPVPGLTLLAFGRRLDGAG